MSSLDTIATTDSRTVRRVIGLVALLISILYFTIFDSRFSVLGYDRRPVRLIVLCLAIVFGIVVAYYLWKRRTS